jgi:F5/8 type C domain-containing protein
MLPQAPPLDKDGVYSRPMQFLQRSLDRFRSNGGKKDASKQDPELRRRACLARELARRALVEPVEHGPADAVACELYRQAIYWGLLARRGAESGDVERAALADLFADADPALVERYAGGPGEAARLRSRLEQASFTAFADLPASERAALLGDAERFAYALLNERDAERERLWTRRLLWTGAALVLASAALIVAPRAIDRWEQSRDLARGKPWTISTTELPICNSPAQVCDEGKDYFFHTQRQKNPWLSIDLESLQKVSAVRVRNRRGCCSERAVPLVVQVSTDGESWTEVARTDEEFSEWKAEFSPVEARWVRLLVPRTSTLHLRRVRVLP